MSAGVSAAVAPAAEQPAVSKIVERSIILRDVPWQTYQSLRKAEANDHLRMIYDRGELEILMSPLKRHGKIANLLGLMIYEWSRHCRTEIESGRDMTCDREDLEKGLEPDDCYWTINQPLVHGKDEVDFLVDPPPDLALEVDITRSSIPKLPIYQALKIPEVWCWRKNGIEVLALREGKYVHVSESTALPGFPFPLAGDFIQRRNTLGEIALMEQFAAAIARLPR
jgi:Uma2 family endonuclease